MNVHREVRPVRCRTLTIDGEIEGSFNVPPKTVFLDFLNRAEPFFRVTDAIVAGQHAQLPFLALQRAATLAVVPLAATPLEDVHSRGERFAHHVLFLLPAGRVLDGTLDVHGRVRVSDFLLRHPGFVALRDVALYTRDAAGATLAEPGIPEVAVHSSLVVGVSELASR